MDKPRIDLDLLRERSEGLIATLSCSTGVVRDSDNDANAPGASSRTAWTIFAGRFYLELQRHGIPCAGQGRLIGEDGRRPAPPAGRDQRRPLPRSRRPRAARRAALDRDGLKWSTTRALPVRWRGGDVEARIVDEDAETFRSPPARWSSTLEIVEDLRR